MIQGKWLGDERIVVGAGHLQPGPVALPEYLADEFTRQGLFKADPPSSKPVKEPEHVRSDD